MIESQQKPIADETAPLFCRLDRRQLLTFLGQSAATALVVGLSPLGILQVPAGSVPKDPEARRRELPKFPILNPAFLAQGISHGGVVLWTQHASGSYVAYRLNRAGGEIWKRCSGDKPPRQIVDEYQTATGGSPSEAFAFLETLQNLGLIVSGGYFRCPSSSRPLSKIETVLWEEGSPSKSMNDHESAESQ